MYFGKLSSISLLLVMIVLVGCTNKDTNTNATFTENNDTQSVEEGKIDDVQSDSYDSKGQVDEQVEVQDESEDKISEQNKIEEEVTENEEHKDENNPGEIVEEQVITEDGVYFGQVDSNSIEVEISSGPIVLNINEFKGKVDWDNLDVEKEVIISYIENDQGQKILKDIQY
ncbi:hypothetical protein [Metabacillus halosaccharovorans]|uniref:hypothetical protein n=1 Tax=Metabacillus halosaccharovorans TaxID=930124 RepID=UPI00203CFDB4|nr:hypothetical protein [Metabacillus halosaccharovorans]MCM3443784.1 hypothetical protein [Metabacillus halosaccharovorans]